MEHYSYSALRIMVKFKKIVHIILEWLQELTAGLTVSTVGAVLVQEILHLGFIIIGGFVGAIFIHLGRRWARKHFPDESYKKNI